MFCPPAPVFFSVPVLHQILKNSLDSLQKGWLYFVDWLWNDPFV
jgi:hypothetical protein